ncbi:hypothetical protein VHUM_04176 [Vanrija humicola]|uniref:Major facilitator superfamily (MFS) profile domain-containing protein n=1 Tax=Vanrija humicola TaxID=5417 RepID=A0A7D8YZ80_VANHU|nr:hypothetical protein VHUM_04176 [Vanrija humicola]
MCLIEFAERASYYGTKGPFNNFINNKLPKGGNGAGAVAPGEAGHQQKAGALGRGSVTTSALTQMFNFLAYVIPILGGIIADNYWGRFKTIVVGTAIGAIAHIILIIPAIPQVIAVSDAALGIFIVSILILAFAAGFIKPCLGPLLCDQSPVKQPTISYTKKGERVIIDPQTTVSRYLIIFYLCINVGALFQMATQYSARLVGFWLAFLVPGILYMLMPPVLMYCSPRLIKQAPGGSVLPDTFRVIGICMSNGGWKRIGRGGDEWWNKAKPSYIQANSGTVDMSYVHWDDKFVDEIRQTLNACGVFLLLPIFQLADSGSVGLGNLGNDMSDAMKVDGIPNDFLNNFNSISIIVFTPIMTYGVYPFFERIGWPLKPMTRMCIGFLLATVGCIFGAVVQNMIYARSACGKFATHCENDTPTVTLWWQIPIIIFPAIGELLVNVTGYELAYTRSPPRMRALVYSLSLFNVAIAAAISLACSAALTDPNLVIAWIVLACASFVCALIFPTYFRNLNNFTFSWSEDERNTHTAIQDEELARVESHRQPIKDSEKY